MLRSIRESYALDSVRTPDPIQTRVILVENGRLLPGGPSHEEIAVAVALDMSGKKPLSPENRRQYGEAMFLAVKNMLYMLAKKYIPTCPRETVDDLVQECVYKILKKLHGFNPEKGSFTTWVWYVCDSTLNRRYRAGQRAKRRVVLASDILNPVSGGTGDGSNEPIEQAMYREGHIEKECPGIMASEIADAIRELAGRHPQHQLLIYEMFGNPDSDDFVMRSHISVSESAKAVGMEYNKARAVFGKVIRPFFKKQFAGCMLGC